MKHDLSIASVYEADAPNQGAYGGPWGRPNESEHILVPAELDADCIKAEEGEEGIELVEDEEKSEAKVEAQWNELRVERNKRLTACDWTQMADCPLSSEAKADWAAHRQELRDLPENCEDPASPEWPEQP